jgi:hypothetical protein
MKIQIYFFMHLISCMFCLKSPQAETQMDTHVSLCALGLWIRKFHVDICVAGFTLFTLFCDAGSTSFVLLFVLLHSHALLYYVTWDCHVVFYVLFLTTFKGHNEPLL